MVFWVSHFFFPVYFLNKVKIKPKAEKCLSPLGHIDHTSEIAKSHMIKHRSIFYASFLICVWLEYLFLDLRLVKRKQKRNGGDFMLHEISGGGLLVWRWFEFEESEKREEGCSHRSLIIWENKKFDRMLTHLYSIARKKTLPATD